MASQLDSESKNFRELQFPHEFWNEFLKKRPEMHTYLLHSLISSLSLKTDVIGKRNLSVKQTAEGLKDNIFRDIDDWENAPVPFESIEWIIELIQMAQNLSRDVKTTLSGQLQEEYDLDATIDSFDTAIKTMQNIQERLNKS